MASLRLIYDISADMFAVVDNRCIVKPPNILMLLPKRDELSKGYLSCMYGFHLREKYDLSQLYYLICEILRQTFEPINQMLNNQITIENIPTISCQSQNQNTTSNEISSVKVNQIATGYIDGNQNGSASSKNRTAQTNLPMTESVVQDVNFSRNPNQEYQKTSIKIQPPKSYDVSFNIKSQDNHSSKGQPEVLLKANPPNDQVSSNYSEGTTTKNQR